MAGVWVAYDSNIRQSERWLPDLYDFPDTEGPTKRSMGGRARKEIPTRGGGSGCV